MAKTLGCGLYATASRSIGLDTHGENMLAHRKKRSGKGVVYGRDSYLVPWASACIRDSEEA